MARVVEAGEVEVGEAVHTKSMGFRTPCTFPAICLRIFLGGAASFHDFIA